MLCLGQNDYTFGQLLAYEYKSIDGNIRGGNSARGVGYIRRKYIENALLPLAFNGIGFKNTTYNVTDSNPIEDVVSNIETDYTNCSDSTLHLIKIYTDDIDAMSEALTSDLFQTPSSVVQDLYNKCMEQAQLREGVTHPERVRTVIKIMRGKHMPVLISNYDDYNQASDFFLTLGLIPVLFEDWKESFCEEEIEYFKVLVNRSQVKRISNVKANDAYNLLITINKYARKIREMKTQAAIQNIVSSRIRTAQSTVYDAEQSAERYLNNYATEKKRYYDALKVLTQLENNQEEAQEEIKLATTMEGIDNIDSISNGTVLKIGFKDYITFYDAEEADIIINNMQNDWVKELFKDVFLEQKYKLSVYTEFYFSFQNNERNLRQGGELDAMTLNSHESFYNPHIQFFNCLGDYKPQLIDAQAKQDLLVFNNLALASTKSINFRDGAVMNRLQQTLRGYANGEMYNGETYLNIKCLVDEDGNKHSIKEIYLTHRAEPTELDVEDL